MAFTATVTTVGVKKIQPQLYLVTANLKLNDGSTDVIDKNYSVQHNRDNGATVDIETKLTTQMQEDIDYYKKEQVINDSAALATVISNTQSNLVV